MFAGEPFSRAAKARVNLIKNQQCAVLVAELAQQRNKFWWRNVDAAACLNRLDENCADLLAVKNLCSRRRQSAQTFGSRFTGRSAPTHVGGYWKGKKISKLAQLRAERRAKVFAMRGVERAVAEAVICALKRDDATFARCEHRCLKRSFHRLEA